MALFFVTIIYSSHISINNLSFQIYGSFFYYMKFLSCDSFSFYMKQKVKWRSRIFSSLDSYVLVLIENRDISNNILKIDKSLFRYFTKHNLFIIIRYNYFVYMYILFIRLFKKRNISKSLYYQVFNSNCG